MKARGFTLLEAMIAIALAAIIGTLALPSLGGLAERARLKSAAETLASDLAEARFESAQRGRGLHVEFMPGPAWCWSVSISAGCGCREAPCRLRATQAGDHAGIGLVDARSAHFEDNGSAPGGAGALFESTRGEQLRVELSVMGRAKVCAPGGKVGGYPSC